MDSAFQKKRYPYPTSYDWMVAIGDAVVDKKEKAVLNAMHRYLNRKTCYAWPSKRTLARNAGYSERWIREGIKSLVNRGVISILRKTRVDDSGETKTKIIYRLDYHRLRELSYLAHQCDTEDPKQSEVDSQMMEVSSEIPEATAYKQAPTEQIDEQSCWVRSVLVKYCSMRDVDTLMSNQSHSDLAAALKSILEQKQAGKVRSVGGIIQARLLGRPRRKEIATSISSECLDAMHRIEQQRANHGVSRFSTQLAGQD